MAADWLQRAIVRTGALLAKDAERAITSGRVRLRGKIVRTPLTPVTAEDEISLDGAVLPRDAPPLVIAFNKPAGVVTSTVDPHRGATVFHALLQWLPDDLSRFTWHAAGRLDRNTTGLLLFTNNERLVAHLTDPASKLPKRYRAEVSAQVKDAQLEPLRSGLCIESTHYRPAIARRLGRTTVELTLTEGRFHQVKRMLGAVGLPVVALERTAVGSIELDLPPGEGRLLSSDEVRRGLRYPPADVKP